MALTHSCCYVTLLTLSFTASTANKTEKERQFVKRTTPDKPNAEGRHDISYIQKRFSVLDTKNIQSDYLISQSRLEIFISGPTTDGTVRVESVWPDKKCSYLGFALFWEFTQRRIAIPYRRFGAT